MKKNNGATIQSRDNATECLKGRKNRGLLFGTLQKDKSDSTRSFQRKNVRETRKKFNLHGQTGSPANLTNR